MGDPETKRETKRMRVPEDAPLQVKGEEKLEKSHLVQLQRRQMNRTMEEDVERDPRLLSRIEVASDVRENRPLWVLLRRNADEFRVCLW